MVKNFRKFLINWSLIVFSIILLVPFFAVPVAKAAQSVHYSIQLHPGVSADVLNPYAFHIKERFLLNNLPQFRNIYTFDSVLPIGTLENSLKGEFRYLEPDFLIEAQTVYVNDPGFTADSQNIDKQWGLVKAGFTQAWAETIGSPNTTVAIIDTGVDATHQDLQAMNLVQGYNFITNTPISGKVNSDDNGHGTLVAGVLAAGTNNGIGVAGTDWQISIMPIKALDSSGKGDSAIISQAIVWAADHGAKIINLSLGGVGFDHDTTLANAVSYAFNKNVIIVSAAGNDVAKTGGNLDLNPVFPICDDNGVNMIIGVAATDQNDLKADFSNYGKNCIDVSAPGKRILSTINYDPVTQQPSPNSYAFASGTSLAVPFVSGEAALIWSLYPELTNTQVRDRIIRSADPIDALNISQCNGSSCNGMLGTGRINVKNALDIKNDVPAIQEGDIVQSAENSVVYQIVGGQKRPVSSFVQNQRFSGISIKIVPQAQLSIYPEGSYATPREGTLVKGMQDNAIYIISQGMKLPITYQIFLQRKFSFSNVNTVNFPELNSWVTGNLLPPPEGVLVKTLRGKTVYWTVGGSLHPISSNFYTRQGLKIFPIVIISDQEIKNYPKGEAYL